MIGSFKGKNLRRYWECGESRGINPKLAAKVWLLLDALDGVEDVEQLNLPGFGTHRLTGNRQSQWSMVVSHNWRIPSALKTATLLMWILKITTRSEIMDERTEQLKCRERRPSTPGAMLREVVFPELKISQETFAQKLGVSRQTISEVLHEKRPISTDLAWRLGRLLGNGPGLWLNMQGNVDRWDALHIDASKYDDIEPLRKTA